MSIWFPLLVLKIIYQIHNIYQFTALIYLIILVIGSSTTSFFECIIYIKMDIVGHFAHARNAVFNHGVSLMKWVFPKISCPGFLYFVCVYHET